MNKLLLTLFGLIIFSSTFSQDYIVTMKSDTIYGKVKVLSYDLIDRVQIAEQGKKKMIYTAMQVRRATVDGEAYAPVKFDNGIRFMKIVVPGYLSLYSFRGQTQGNYDTKILQKIGGNSIEVPNMGFKKIIGDMIGECPVLVDKVKNGDLGRNNVEQIVNEYNQCILTVSEQRIEAALTPATTPVSELVEKLKSKVNASDLSNKAEVNDLLTSINDKSRKKEVIPSYMKEGLKGYLSSKEDMKADLDQLLALLDN